MADSLAALRRTRRGNILGDKGEALSLPGAGAGAKEVVGAAQEAAAMAREGAAGVANRILEIEETGGRLAAFTEGARYSIQPARSKLEFGSKCSSRSTFHIQ